MKSFAVGILSFFCAIAYAKPYYNTLYISGDGFRSMADHIFDSRSNMADGSAVQYGDIIFVNADLLNKFFNLIHPTINCGYILITNNSDLGAPREYEGYLDDERVIRWFGQNPTITDHEKFIPIPLGIANPAGQHMNAVHGKEARFTRCLGLKYKGKKWLLGYNFNVFTAPKNREYVARFCASLWYARDLHHVNHLKYLYQMRLAQYVVSPPGNGLDCHRIWEALIVGTIPIVLSSPLNPLLADLPVLIINDWSEIIDPQFLINHYDALNCRFNNPSMEKIRYDYWYKLIKNFQKTVRNIEQ